MIERVTLSGFRCHAATSVPLAPLTVIVGPNGSGKTSILSGLHLASQLCRKSFWKVFSGPRSPEVLVRTGGDAFSNGLAAYLRSVAALAPLLGT